MGTMVRHGAGDRPWVGFQVESGRVTIRVASKGSLGR